MNGVRVGLFERVILVTCGQGNRKQRAFGSNISRLAMCGDPEVPCAWHHRVASLLDLHHDIFPPSQIKIRNLFQHTNARQHISLVCRYLYQEDTL